MFNDFRTCGVANILIAVVDGLKGLREAIATVFPRMTVQGCIVHLIRNSNVSTTFPHLRVLQCV